MQYKTTNIATDINVNSNNRINVEILREIHKRK